MNIASSLLNPVSQNKRWRRERERERERDERRGGETGKRKEREREGREGSTPDVEDSPQRCQNRFPILHAQ